jgi:mono/diheme cytochrome c family protein
MQISSRFSPAGFFSFATRGSAILTTLLAGELAAQDHGIKPSTAAIVHPFIKEHCVSCHGPEKQKGKLRLDTLGQNFSDPLTAQKWAEVVNALNANEMPPEDEPQPKPGEAGKFADWLAAELGNAEIAKRSTRVVLRRMNRAEYNNTIRDLVGLDLNLAEAFPQDPPAGGFDNIGSALTFSPMQMELYSSVAKEILDRALVEGPEPPKIKWRFDPEKNSEGYNKHIVERGGQRSIRINKGENAIENDFVVVHHPEWNTGMSVGGFKIPEEGEYVVRFRAAGRVPTRATALASARTLLEKFRDDMSAKYKNPAKFQKEFEDGLKHFETSRSYNYGPPRARLSQTHGGVPSVLAELDIDAPESEPKVYETRTYLTKQDTSVHLGSTYNIPKTAENQWVQKQKGFARPELMVDWIELEGPLQASWPPPSHQRLLFDSPNKDKDEKAYAREVLTRFMTRAYRRPVQLQEVAAKMALFEKLRKDKPSFLEAIKVPLAAVLTSPSFLFLVEPEAPASQLRKLNGYELATRLSYFLWSSMPDEELFRLAANGELLKPAVLGMQASRMILDPKNEAFVNNFAGQWLGLRKVGANPPADNLYPEYDRHLEISMVRETKGFFAEILRNDLDARNLIKSDFVTINERLARFYGIPGVKGDALRRVPAPPQAHRGGLVTQASIQIITSNGTRTSPVVRGVWILKTLLGTDPGLPVENVGEIANKVPGIDKATVRQRLAIHRELASCARCHDKIDPLGLAMENFDASGDWRDRESHGWQGRTDPDDPLIDASATMPDGSKFEGVEGLQEQLLKKEDLFLTSLASQLYTYGLGRQLGFSDRPAVRASVEAMKRNRYLLRALLLTIVQSDLFTTK